MDDNTTDKLSGAASQDSLTDSGALATIAELVNVAYTMRLYIKNNGVECLAGIEPKEPGGNLSTSEFIELLNANGIVNGINGEALQQVCTAISEGTQLEGVVIARGTPPEPGRDGKIEFHVRTSAEEVQFEEDATGTIDFRQQHTYGNVEVNQPICTIYLPEEGKAGVSVRGELIHPPEVKSVVLKTGDGVHLENDGSRVIADKAGRVIYLKDTVTVTDELVVEGDVDFEVGHINFKGYVIVKGDVLDDFNVSGEKGIKVIGTIGACVLESGGDIEIGGMAGQDKGVIRCGGNLHARYLHEVTVECSGNVIIETELLNSSVSGGGFISTPGGIISGGEHIARSGIEAKILGSRVGIHTRLTAGIHYRDKQRLEELFARLNEITQQLAKTSDRQATASLSAEKSTIQKETVAIRTRSAEDPEANPKVNVHARLLDNVTVTLGTTTELLTDVNGPCSIVENAQEGGFSYPQLTPLTVHNLPLAVGQN